MYALCGAIRRMGESDDCIVAFFERKNNENANISISKLISEKFIIGIGIQFYHYLNMLRRIQRDLI
ncbi:unnamed protein product [Callosobruchus maculatus]|nr:unnamed protein product [Callosobruchus maculatus]